jgi:voltage-gated potassium channel
MKSDGMSIFRRLIPFFIGISGYTEAIEPVLTKAAGSRAQHHLVGSSDNMTPHPSTQLLLPSGRQPTSRFMRLLRAIRRDSAALFREFRIPLLVFLLAVLGGGFLYRELLGVAGKVQPPHYDMPYYMLSLMVLETPMAVPDEPYLIAFWYLMPAIAIYVIGRGAVDFVRLFFNRNERRRAWEEAVASTYRNHIIVMGAGHVGMRVTRTLANLGFDVVVINLNATVEIDAELTRLSVPLVVGDARDSLVLEKTGLPYADAFVVCTSEDYVNLETIMAVRDMKPDIRIVARIWDSRFSRQIQQFMGVNVVLSASDLAAPVFAASAVGLEITQTINVHGREYSMIRLVVAPGSLMDGHTVGTLQSKYDIDVVLHAPAIVEIEGRTNGMVDVHPSRELMVRAGDTIVIFASHDRIVELVQRNRANSGTTSRGRFTQPAGSPQTEGG